MIKKIFTSIFLLVAIYSVSQNNVKPKKSNDNFSLEKADSIQYKLIEKDFEIKNLENEIKNFKEINKLELKVFETNINNRIDKLETKFDNYLIFGGVLITLFVFIVNYYGRRLIKEKIEKLIERTASEFAEDKTNAVLKDFVDNSKINQIIIIIIEKGEPAIREIIKKLENQGNSAIDGFKERTNAIIGSMLSEQERVS